MSPLQKPSEPPPLDRPRRNRRSTVTKATQFTIEDAEPDTFADKPKIDPLASPAFRGDVEA